MWLFIWTTKEVLTKATHVAHFQVNPVVKAWIRADSALSMGNFMIFVTKFTKIMKVHSWVSF